MTNLIDSVKRRTPQELPIVVEILPAAWTKYREKLLKITQKYPDIIPYMTLKHYDMLPERYKEGFYTDEWGCIWENRNKGHDGICKSGPIDLW